jgi:hypothetical protein
MLGLSVRKGVKGHDVKTRRRRQVQKPSDAATHLVGRLLGKGYGEDAGWVDVLPDEMNETAGQSTRLAITWPRQGQLNRCLTGGSRRLCGIKPPHRPLTGSSCPIVDVRHLQNAAKSKCAT